MIESLRFKIGNEAFSELVRRWMKLRHVTIEELSARTGVSVDLVKEMRRPKMKDKQKRFRLKNVIAIAVGLHLPFEYSIQLLECAGYRLREDDIVDKFIVASVLF